MSIFGMFKGKGPRDKFGGGDGSSFKSAVIINAEDHSAGVKAEYAYVAAQCGKPQQDWSLVKQALHHHDDKPYDVLTINLRNGQERTFHFDISKFFGK